MELYEEMKKKMATVMEAEDNAAAWKDEARIRAKGVTALINAAKKIDPDAADLSHADIVKMLRADLRVDDIDETEDDTDNAAEPTDEPNAPAEAEA